MSWSPDGKKLLLGSGPGIEPSSSPNAVIRLLTLDTGQMTIVPGSQGLFSPRWSPDGRYIAALSFDSQRMVLFEFATGTWTDLVSNRTASVGWESWSPDSRFVSYEARYRDTAHPDRRPANGDGRQHEEPRPRVWVRRLVDRVHT